MSTLYTIYLAKNKINQKCYVGFDSAWPARQSRHKISHVRGNSKFYNALRKHGWDNFEWSILYQSVDGEHCLNIMENHFISELDSFNNGYNMTTGGEGVIGYKHSEIRKEKIRQKSLGRTASIETKKKMAESHRGKKHHNFNKPISIEQKNKISASLKGVVP